MSFRIFKNRSRKQDMMLLSGWLFADLLLGLMTIFMISIPPRVTLPPTLTADPIALSPTDQHCQGGTNAPTCQITLRETANSDGKVNWTPSSDMSDGNNLVQFTPQTGILSPGQSTTITISNFPCQNGSFTIKGSRNAMPVVITWQCKVPRVKLEDTAVDFTIKIRFVQIDCPRVFHGFKKDNSKSEESKWRLKPRATPSIRTLGFDRFAAAVPIPVPVLG